jgi:hypothetical protein
MREIEEFDVVAGALRIGTKNTLSYKKILIVK